MSIKRVLTFFGWPLLLLPTLLMAAGITMNEAVIHANGGRMPVEVYNCAARMQERDYTHFCMVADTKEKILGDILVSDDRTASVGDELQVYSDIFEKVCYALWGAIGVFCLVRKEKFYME
jgi:hypothetical protein